MAARQPGSEVLVFIIDAGGGHRSAANALCAAADETGWPHKLRVLNLQSVMAPVDFTRRITGRSMEDTYNVLVRRGWTRMLVPMLRVLHWLIRRLHGRLTRTLRLALPANQPLAVVSLMPNFNAVIRDAVRQAHPGVPFIIVLTDLADFPPHFWIEPGVDRVVVASEEARAQALALGIPYERISQTSGMLLHPHFYSGGRQDTRHRVRATLGIDNGAFTVLLLFGGKGSPEMVPLCEGLLREAADWHVIAICGDNPTLYARLAPLQAAANGRLHRLGFTDRVADYLSACDMLVTKPGPGSLSEAFHQRVPVVVSCNRRTVPQERFNARLVESSGLGLVVRHWKEIPAAIRQLVNDPVQLAAVRARLANLRENRAVYEVLEIIAREIGGAYAMR